VKFLCFVFIGMGVYGLLAGFYGAAILSFAMSGLVVYGHKKMLRDEAKGDTGSDRDSLG
jgi:hypothetical protein